MSRILSRAGRDLAYLALGGLTSVLAMGAWIAGLTISASLAVFVIGIPAFVGTALVFRQLTELDRRNAALVLGAPLRGRYRDQRGLGLLARLSVTIRDGQTWRDLAWLITHSAVGFAFGCAALSAVAEVLALAVLPAWWWAMPDDAQIWGLWRIDDLGLAFATALLAIPLAIVTVVLLRVMALGEARLARALLGRPASGPAALAPEPPRAPRDYGAGLSTHAALAALVGFLCTAIWGLTSAGYFWPVWVWLGVALTVALHHVVVRALRAAGDGERAFLARVELCAVIAALCVAIWALAGGGYFWPIWPLLGMSVALAVRGLFAFRHRLPWVRERELEERVDVLTRTRRGALDVQAAELRRIERDLHDGAQARLVALSMQLGRAEERLADQPEVADLVRRARDEASAAIGELRDLARGIAPPVLADRGLAAAADALGRRSPMPVTVDAQLAGRPLPVVETAAYFVVAEALTNAAKHAGGAPARVTLREDGERLTVEVADQGPGGADAKGSGLTGLRHRVEALDGTLEVTSPPGGGTVVRAELPCAW